jgi:hypothetical protein
MTHDADVPTNPETSARLLAKARKIGSHEAKHAITGNASTEPSRHRQQQKIVRLFGTVEFDPAFNYKSERAAR